MHPSDVVAGDRKRAFKRRLKWFLSGVVLLLGLFYAFKRTTDVAPSELQLLASDITRHNPVHCLIISRQVSRSLVSGKPTLVPRFLAAYADAKITDIRSRRTQAGIKLGHMGTNLAPVIPALAAALDDQDSEVRWAALTLLCKVRVHQSPLFEDVKFALNGRSRPIPQLVWVLQRPQDMNYYLGPAGPEVRRFALLSLSACAPTPTLVPVLTNFISSKEEEPPTRALAVATLAWHGKDVTAAAEFLQTLLRNPAEWPEIRAAAGCALVGKMPRDELLADLRNMLRGSEARARVGAAEGLWELKVPAQEILSVLQDGLSHNLPSVRFASLKVIQKMGGQAFCLRSAVESVLADPKEAVRREATNTLVLLGNGGSQAIYR
jgi:HEAT repeat protein